MSIPKEESATIVPGEKPIWIDIGGDRLLDALEFCRDQILNDKKNDLVVLYDRTLPEELKEKVNQKKEPRSKRGFGWRKILPWESFVGGECDTVIYVGTGSLEAFSRARLKLMIITVTPTEQNGQEILNFYSYKKSLRTSVEKTLCAELPIKVDDKKKNEDGSDIDKMLNDIQQGSVLVLCEHSKDVEALHKVLKNRKEKLVTVDPGSTNKEFHRTDLGNKKKI